MKIDKITNLSRLFTLLFWDKILILALLDDICIVSQVLNQYTCKNRKNGKCDVSVDVYYSYCRFPMVSYCTSSRRICVGSKNGTLAFYELKQSKAQVSLVAISFMLDYVCQWLKSYTDDWETQWPPKSSSYACTRVQIIVGIDWQWQLIEPGCCDSSFSTSLTIANTHYDFDRCVLIFHHQYI